MQLHLDENFRNYFEAEFCATWYTRSEVSSEDAIHLFLNRFKIRADEGRESLKRLLEERVKTLEIAYGKWESKQSRGDLQWRNEIERISRGVPSGLKQLREAMGRA